MVALADISPRQEVLEPSAGTGAPSLKAYYELFGIDGHAISAPQELRGCCLATAGSVTRALITLRDIDLEH